MRQWVRAGMWLAILLGLLGSLNGVAYAFSTLDAGVVFGVPWAWIKAGAVDLGFVFLAVGIQERRRAGAPVLWLWVGAGLFLAISTYANLLFGEVHRAVLPIRATWVSARSIPLGAALPLLVFYLTEIVTAQGGGAGAGKPPPKVEARPPVVTPREAGKASTKSRVLDYKAKHPDASQAEIAEALGIHRSTVGRYLRQGRA